MEKGWIKLHNKFLDWEWFDEPHMVHVFLHLLLRANYKESNWHGLKIGRGQLEVGRKQLAKTLGISEQSVRTCITRLKSTNEITSKSTNKFSIITIVNWDKYQGREENQPTNQPTSQPTTNQQLTSNQPHLKNIRSKEVKKEILYTPEFEEFWREYPKKTGKVTAFSLWKNLHPSIYPVIMADIVSRRADKKWQEGFVKDPERYLKYRQWEDEIINTIPQVKVHLFH